MFDVLPIFVYIRVFLCSIFEMEKMMKLFSSSSSDFDLETEGCILSYIELCFVPFLLYLSIDDPFELTFNGTFYSMNPYINQPEVKSVQFFLQRFPC